MKETYGSLFDKKACAKVDNRLRNVNGEEVDLSPALVIATQLRSVTKGGAKRFAKRVSAGSKIALKRAVRKAYQLPQDPSDRGLYRRLSELANLCEEVEKDPHAPSAPRVQRFCRYIGSSASI